MKFAPYQSPKLVKIIHTHAPLSPRLLRACSMFGLGVFSPPPARTWKLQLSAILRASLQEGQLIHLSGPSGCGKSTLLRAVTRRLREQGREVIVARRAHFEPDCSLLDCLPGSLDEAFASLHAAGLSEATLYPRRIADLSEGQRARAHIAWALARVRQTASLQPIVVIIDELASTLDSLTAQGLCIALAKAAKHQRIVVLSASAREEVATWLSANHPLPAPTQTPTTQRVNVHLHLPPKVTNGTHAKPAKQAQGDSQ